MNNTPNHLPFHEQIKFLKDKYDHKRLQSPTPPPPPTPSVPKVSEYAAAETYNALHGGAPDNVIAERLKICGGCEFRSTTYKGATDPDNFGWCTKCGCGNNPRALLVTKARLAQVSCPLTPPRWEKVEGVGC